MNNQTEESVSLSHLHTHVPHMSGVHTHTPPLIAITVFYSCSIPFTKLIEAFHTKVTIIIF